MRWWHYVGFVLLGWAVVGFVIGGAVFTAKGASPILGSIGLLFFWTWLPALLLAGATFAIGQLAQRAESAKPQEVLWYRRSATIIAFTVIGAFLIPPLLWAACVICLTGDIGSDREKKDQGSWRLSTVIRVIPPIIVALQALLLAYFFNQWNAS